MLELICQQSYTWDGLPADKSPYRNHGAAINTSGGSDGIEPGSGVITFPHADSRVRIPVGPAWQPMTALKIEALVKVDPGLKRTFVLVAGDGSFRFGVTESALVASFKNLSGVDNYVRSADAFAPDQSYHPVPANVWSRSAFNMMASRRCGSSST